MRNKTTATSSSIDDTIIIGADEMRRRQAECIKKFETEAKTNNLDIVLDYIGGILAKYADSVNLPAEPINEVKFELFTSTKHLDICHAMLHLPAMTEFDIYKVWTSFSELQRKLKDKGYTVTITENDKHSNIVSMTVSW